MRGRPRKPTIVKKAQGTLQPSRTNPYEPQPQVKLPAAPRGLDPVAKKTWRRVGKELEQMGVISRLDMDAFACYCGSVSDYWSAVDLIKKIGPVVAIETNYGKSVKPNPAFAQKYAAMRAIREFANEFGLTPAARSKVSAQEQDDEVGQRAAKYMRLVK